MAATGAVTKFNPMTALLKRVTTFPTSSACDVTSPYVTSLQVSACGGRVFMADLSNKQIKVASLDQGDKLQASLSLDLVRPFKMAAMENEVLAVSSNQGLLLVDVTGDPYVSGMVKTSRVYRGVASDRRTSTVVAGCGKDEDGAASVDVISTTDGTLLKTIIDSHLLATFRSPATYFGTPEAWLAQLKATFDSPVYWTMTSPSSLWVHEGEVMIADAEAAENGVHRADLTTGKLKDVVSPLLTSLARPQDVCVDSNGHLFVATGQLVMAQSPEGQWREVLSGWQHGEGECVWPVAVSVSPTGLLVSWTDGRCRTIVKSYSFV